MKHSRNILLILILCSGLCISSAAEGTSPETAYAYSTDNIQFDDDGNPIFIPKPVSTKGDLQPDQMYVPGSVIVVYEEPEMATINSNDALSAAVNDGISAEVTKSYVTGVLPGCQVISLPETITVDEAVTYYESQPGVKYAEPNYILTMDTMPNDPYYSLQWGLNNTGQATPQFPSGGISGADISAEDAWDVTTGSEDIVIAVIDSGVDYLHDDLVANMWDDGTGHCGYDFINDDNEPMDYDGHGTHCAGIIAAAGNNSIGTTGVCWNAKIMALKILSPNGGTIANEIEAINYAYSNGADILSCSYGTCNFSQSEKDAIENSGLLTICAAGNKNEDNDFLPKFPSSHNCSNIVSVAATAPDDTLSEFSNFGATRVDLGAPGSDIYSTLPSDIEYEMTTLVFSDDMSSLSNWLEANLTGSNRTEWYLDSGNYTSAPSSAAIGPYNNESDQWLFKNGTISLANLTHPALNFELMYDTQENDGAYVLVWEDRIPNNSVMKFYSGNSSGFTEQTIDLSNLGPIDFRGKDIRIALGFVSNESITGNGVWFDDIRVGQLEVSKSTPQYGYSSGTSMAAPMVSGAAGIVMAAHPDYTWEEVKADILDSTDPLPALEGKCVTGGRLNISIEEEKLLDADFTADATKGTAPLTVNFTDTSTGEPTAWAWDFGNGDTSTDQNASYTYTTAGKYTVSLTVEDEEENSDTETKEGYITVLPGESPVIRFSPNSSSVRIGTETVHSVVLDSVPKGLAGFNLTLSLGNQTVAEIVGTSPPEWASNWSTSDVPADSVWISAKDFDSLVNPGETDILLGNVTVRGDAVGTTELTIVVNEMEDDSGDAITPLIEPATISIEEAKLLDANFTADVTNGTAPLTVNFTDTSTGNPTAWIWDFGTGDTSTDPDASYTYTTAGNYTVSLTVEDEELNNDTETKEGYITVLPGESPVIRFSPNSSSVRIGTETVHSVVLDSVPKGLAGFNLTLSLGNQTVAEIVGTAPPEWASNWSTSDVPADSVWISAEDFDSLVNPGETDILLGNVTVRGDAEGTTELTIVVNEMEDDSGDAITPLTEPAAITVNYTLVPFPGASAPPTDPDNDGLFEDINGNGVLDFADVVLYVKEIDWIPDNQQISLFDFNQNGRIDFDDAVQLAREV